MNPKRLVVPLCSLALIGLGVALLLLAGRQTTRGRGMALDSPQTGPVSVAKAKPLPRVVPLAGELRGPKGELVAEARLLVTPVGNRFLPTFGRSDRRGRFRVALPAAGLYHVLVFSAGRARFHRLVRATSGGVQLGTIALQPEALVRGRVLDPDGKPVPGAEIAALPVFGSAGRPAPAFVARADAKGHFVLRGLSARDYRLSAKAKGFAVTVLQSVTAPGVDVMVRLAQTFDLLGKVTRDGKPAAGAVVRLAGSGVWPPVRVAADAQGGFRFRGVRQGIYHVRAAHDDWVSRPLVGIEVFDRDVAVALKLERGVRLTGVVRDEITKAPIGGARLTLSEDLLAVSPSHAETDAEGKFQLGPVLPGEYLISLRSYGYLPEEGEPLDVKQGPNPPLDLTMRPGAHLKGLVLDDTGKPVVGARIEVVGRARGSYIADRSSITVALQAQVWKRLVGALKALLAAPKKGPSVGARLPAPASAEAALTTETWPRDPRWSRLPVTHGPVPQLPAVDARVDTAGGGRQQFPTSGDARYFVTDDKGRFDIAGIPPGSISIYVHHPEYASKRVGPFWIGEKQREHELEVRLRPGIELRGTVLDPLGKPIPGAMILAARGGSPFQQRVRTADDRGQWRFANLLGWVRLELSAPGFVPKVHRLRLRPPPGKERGLPQDVVVRLTPARESVRGVVIDRLGFPVSGALLTFASVTPDFPSRGTAVTGADGTFSATGLGRLRYQVIMRHADYPRHEFWVGAPSSGMKWYVSYGGGLEFSVRDGKTGESLDDFQFVLARKGGKVRRQSGFGGRAKLVPLPAGQYTLTVRAAGYAPVKKKLWIPPGRRPGEVTRHGVSIALDLAGAMSGRVRDAQGNGIEGAEVKAGDVSVLTTEDGQFELQGVSPGERVVSASHPEHGKGATEGVEVQSGRHTAGVVIELDGRGAAPKALQGTVAIRLGVRGGKLVVTQVTEGSGAESAGIAVGDEVVGIDGHDLGGLGRRTAATMLRGPAGSRVVLQLVRDERSLSVSVKREIR